MQTRHWTLVSVILLCTGAGTWSFASRAHVLPEHVELVGEDALDQIVDGADAEASQPLPVEGRFVVDVASLVDHLDELTVDERPQQLADWAVYGAVLRHGGESDTIAEALFDRTPMRDPALADVVNYDYDPGRRVYVGNDQVWLFYSAFDPHPDVTLGRLADTVRMERGEIPDAFQVYSFRSEIAGTGEIVVERLPDVSGLTMFSPAYGYYETLVDDVTGLGTWLEKVDDLAYVAIEGAKARLGGRRFERARTRGVDLDDIAVLYRAQLSGDRDPGFSLDPQAKTADLIRQFEQLRTDPRSILAEARARIASADPLDSDPTAYPFDLQIAQLTVEQADQIANLDEVRLSPRAADLLTQTIDELKRLPFPGGEQAAVSLAQRLEALLTAGFFPASEDLLAAGLVRYINSRTVVQCARYDGPVRGTRAAMTMFYTDVMMKVWQSVDYYGSAPGRHVPGFRNGVDELERLEPEYLDEVSRLPSTRIWLGPRAEGYALTAEGTLSFAPIVTRLYAAGSNPLNPGEESTEVNRSNLLTIGWWHRHYAEVADYEQEYHRQNQLMKWSLATVQLAEAGLLRALSDRSVATDQRFPDWYRDHESLRFKKNVRLLPEARWVSQDECMERLTSRQAVDAGGGRWTVSGGVSLGGRSALAGSRVSSAADQLAVGIRRGADISPSVGRAVTSAQRGSYRFIPNGAGRVRVSLGVKGAPRYRRFGSDVTLSRLDTSIAMRGRTVAIEMKIDTGTLGRFYARRMSGRIALGWRDGSVSRGLTRRSGVAEAGKPASPSEHFLDGLARSDPKAAAAELRAIARSGELDALMTDYARRADVLAKAGLRENPVASAEILKAMAKQPGAADDAVLRTIIQHRRGAPVPEAQLSPGASAELTGVVRGGGRSSRPGAASPSPRPEARVTVKSSGPRLVTAMAIDPSKVQVLKGAARREALDDVLRSGNADLYVQRSGLLRELDFDALPYQSLRHVAKDPRVEWIKVLDENVLQVRPDRVSHEGAELAKYATGRFAALAPLTPVASIGGPVIMLRLSMSDEAAVEADEEDDERHGIDLATP